MILPLHVLPPAVFAVLEKTEPGRAGEIQLTDALATLATMLSAWAAAVHGVIFPGRRYAPANPVDYPEDRGADGSGPPRSG